MFAGLNQLPPGVNLPPLFETRKALIIINLQNDSFYVNDDLYITKNPDFVPRLKEMIPYFRKHGDIIWVKTHMGVLPQSPTSSVAEVEKESAKKANKNQEEQKRKEQQMQHASQSTPKREETAGSNELEPIDPNAGPGNDYPSYYPSSKTKAMMRQASAETRAEKRSADLQVFDDKENTIEQHLSKPRKGRQARFYIAGTKGAEICDELQDMVDESSDLIVTKHHYSAFDQTSLLTALRAKLVTEVYLCGCLTNVGVYSTAADAVQHGLQVTVVEDCLGYRSEEKHEEAMRQMADIMGVHGIDSEEIIEESGGRPVPDAQTPGITLDDLSLQSPAMASRGLPGTGVDISNQQTSTVQPQDSPSLDTEPNPSPNQKTAEQNSSPPAKRLHDKLEKTVDEHKIAQTPSSGSSSKKNRSSWNLTRSHTLGPENDIGSGDSRIIHETLDPLTAKVAFTKVKEEVSWQTMFHRSGEVPRLVAVQGDVGPDGEKPIYRHPADESPPLSPFTPMLQKIRREIETTLGQSFNHALIQLYRDGVDSISEHSDKTLDIVRGSVIVNVSLGAQRTMTLRTKKPKHQHGTDSPTMRQSQKIPMPHNSVFVLGPQTNREWLHGVRADKRPAQEKSDEEKAFGGERISITFRQIGTFMDKRGRHIWGAGATAKNRDEAVTVSKDSSKMEAMIIAFGKENHNADFDWDAEYDSGFDVVNLVTKQAKLYLCSDSVANQRVQLTLFEKSIPFEAVEREATREMTPDDAVNRFHTWMHGLSNSSNPIFSGLDETDSEIEGDLTIMMHLEKQHPFSEAAEESTPNSDPPNISLYTQLTQSNELLFLWRELRDSQKHRRDSPPTNRFRLEESSDPGTSLREEFHSNLDRWEAYLGDSLYVAGEGWTIIDCAFWPVLHHLIEAYKEFSEQRYPKLLAYHQRALSRDCVRLAIGDGR